MAGKGGWGGWLIDTYLAVCPRFEHAPGASSSLSMMAFEKKFVSQRGKVVLFENKWEICAMESGCERFGDVGCLAGIEYDMQTWDQNGGRS